MKGTTYGGYFRTYSRDGIAVYGWARKDKAGYSGTGGQFIIDGVSGVAVSGLATATSGDTMGGSFLNNSAKGMGVYAYVSIPTGTTYGVFAGSNSPDGYAVYSSGNMRCTKNLTVDGKIVTDNQLVKGNHIVNGTKSAVVKLKNGEGVTLYAVEASENWFEDFGSAKLKDGAAVVAIDPLYSETVNTEYEAIGDRRKVK